MTLDHRRFMDRAMELATVDRDGKVVGEGRNLVHTGCDPTAHGEIVAIRNTALSLRTVDLAGCTLYTSMEPCPMCCWAIIDSKISRLVLGCRHAALQRKDIGSYSVEALVAMTGRPLEIVTGIRARECEALRRSWKGWRAFQGEKE